MVAIPKGITGDDVRLAIKRLDAGEAHPFGPSRKYDLVHEGRRYPPKAVLGLAAQNRTGTMLTPVDFVGGDESRCHAVLKGLHFTIEQKSVGRPKIDRGNPVVAQAVIETLLAGVTQAKRRAILQFLAESLAFSAATNPERWGVTLEPGHVRFNVGQTEAVVLWPGEVCVLVADSARIADTTLGDPYPSAGGARLRRVPFEHAARVLPGIRGSHEVAMSAAMRRPSTPVIKEAYSAGVPEYLWETLRIDGAPPVPAYASELRSRQGDRLSMEAERAVMALPDLEQSEKMAVIKVRLAQRLFRARLTAARRCCGLTGVTNPDYLRASHIKPWRVCSDQEKQDANNGLLLAPHVDLLFDQGYLSFENDGTVLISPRLDRVVLEAWGLAAAAKVRPFSEGQHEYLKYHRQHVFDNDRG